VVRKSAAVRAPQVPATASPKAFVDAYCVTCHNQRLKTADLTLDTLDPSAPATNAVVWEKVLRKVRTGAMPPAQVRQPDKQVAEAFHGGARRRRSIGPPLLRFPDPGAPTPRGSAA
jgi:hypothetical protein